MIGEPRKSPACPPQKCGCTKNTIGRQVIGNFHVSRLATASIVISLMHHVIVMQLFYFHFDDWCQQSNHLTFWSCSLFPLSCHLRRGEVHYSPTMLAAWDAELPPRLPTRSGANSFLVLHCCLICWHQLVPGCAA